MEIHRSVNLQGERIQNDIAEGFGVSQSVKSRFLNRFLKTGDAQRRQGQGWGKNINVIKTRYLNQLRRRFRILQQLNFEESFLRYQRHN